MFRLDIVHSQVPNPEVINEALLREILEGELGSERYQICCQNEYREVAALRISFRNVLKIENLHRFSSLVRLELNNNVIEKVEGLDGLPHLKYLDLSFNFIRSIENIDHLVNLEELSFFENRIAMLGSMDNLSKLIFLSVGNNRLDDLESAVVYLRRLPRLRSLTLLGNPLCRDARYARYTAALLGELVYLDYRRITVEERRETEGTFGLTAFNLLTLERGEQEKREEESRRDEVERLYVTAGVVDFAPGRLSGRVLGCHDLLASLAAGFPSVAVLSGRWATSCEEMVARAFDSGLLCSERQRQRRAAFERSVCSTLSWTRERSEALTGGFMDYKAALLSDLNRSPSDGDGEAARTNAQQQQQKTLPPSWVQEYSGRLSSTGQKLYRLEIHAVERLEETTKNFEVDAKEINGACLEEVRDLLRALREKLADYQTSLREAVRDAIQQPEGGDANLAVLLEDLPLPEGDIAAGGGDSLEDAISDVQELQNLIMDRAEDGFASHLDSSLETYLEKMRKETGLERNRRATTEISQFLDFNRQLLESSEEESL